MKNKLFHQQLKDDNIILEGFTKVAGAAVDALTWHYYPEVWTIIVFIHTQKRENMGYKKMHIINCSDV